MQTNQTKAGAVLARVRGYLRTNLIAFIALFFALGGTAFAAKPLITGAQIQNESLTGADVLNNSLTGDDVSESSLSGIDASKLGGKIAADFGEATTDYAGSVHDTVLPAEGPATVLSKTVPAGSYLILAEGIALNDSETTPYKMNCAIVDPGGIVEKSEVVAPPRIPQYEGTATVVMSQAVTYANETQINWRCTGDGHTVPGASLRDAELHVIALDATN
jgi:hypothetical protein